MALISIRFRGDNPANRLIAVNGPPSIVHFAYNGLGDRLSQTVNGQTTIYTLDLHAGLPQALSDGERTYLYGHTRLAQLGMGTPDTDYFLGDALGSVRQLTDMNGAVTYAAAYAPYGEVLVRAGETITPYGFTGEWTDPTGLVYLQARYYAPWQGMFLSRDVWDGEAERPVSYNAWLYEYGNPVNSMDPSGQYPCQVCQWVPRGWSREMCERCCEENFPVLEYVGDFNLSAYYTARESEPRWRGNKVLVEAVPFRGGKYLARGGGYTDSRSEALTAKKDFLMSKGGVCTQGSGILADGRIIYCSTVEPKFEWGTVDDLREKTEDFRTVARCQWSRLLRQGDVIRVECQWLSVLLARYGNRDGYLTVTDVGQASGLCNSAGQEGIDVYLGIGAPAFRIWGEEFQKYDTLYETRYHKSWWPVYRKK